MDQARGHIAIVLSCLIFATNIIVTSSLTENWMTPIGYTLSRLLYGAVALWIIGLFFVRERVTGKDFLILALGGFLGFVVSQLAFATSVQYTSPVNFSLIMAMVPIAVLLLSMVFLKEHAGATKIAGACMVIWQRGSGDVGGGSNDLLGLGIAVLSMTSYAAYLTITREVTQKYASITILKWMYLFTAAMVLPFGLEALPQQRIYAEIPPLLAIAQLLFVFVFDTTLVFFLLLFALSRLKATTVSTYLNLLPIFTSAIAIALGQELLTFGKVLATALVVGGVCLVTRDSKEAQ